MYSHTGPPCFSRYPPPTNGIIHRIGLQMLNVPELYFGVLDVMRSMNLPAPFCEDSAIFEPANHSCVAKSSKGTQTYDVEFEDDEDEDNEMPSTSSFQDKCIHDGNGLRLTGDNRTRLKRILESAKYNPRNSSNDHLKNYERNQPKISIDLKSVCAGTMAPGESAPTGTFGTFSPPPPDQNLVGDRSQSPAFDFNTCLNLSDIQRSVISNNEKRRHKLFKNYRAGTPCSRLYVKNIPKKATKNDLRRIFGTFARPKFQDLFNVCFMTKGKLHGQAFVTYNDEELAEKALNCTNGYSLHGKPLVVVFARSRK